MHDIAPLMDNCITITPGVLNSNYIISEHIYIYGFIYQRLCCMFILHRFTVLSWCNISSTVVLNLMYLPTLSFAHSNISRDFCNSIRCCIQTIINIRDCAVCLYWVTQCYIDTIVHPRVTSGVLKLMYL